MASNWSLLELVRLRASQINGERPTRCIGRGAVASVRRVTDATSFQLSVTLRERPGLGNVFVARVSTRLGDLDGNSRIEDRLLLTDSCALT
jgi:hypothetical protein